MTTETTMKYMVYRMASGIAAGDCRADFPSGDRAVWLIGHPETDVRRPSWSTSEERATRFDSVETAYRALAEARQVLFGVEFAFLFSSQDAILVVETTTVRTIVERSERNIL